MRTPNSVEIISAEPLNEREKLSLFLLFEEEEGGEWQEYMISTGEEEDGRGRVSIYHPHGVEEWKIAQTKWCLSRRRTLARKFRIDEAQAWSEYMAIVERDRREAGQA